MMQFDSYVKKGIRKLLTVVLRSASHFRCETGTKWDGWSWNPGKELMAVSRECVGLGLAKKVTRVYASRNATGSAPTLKSLMLVINILWLQKHS